MLEIADLSFHYGRRQVLHGVSLKVAEREIVTLVGSNGAGKTTLLKTISGLRRPSAGTISFAGQRIDRLSPHKIIELGLVHVPEGRLLFPDMTVGDHLELGAMRAPASAPPYKQRLADVLSLFPILAERWRQKAGALSGGQQQMVAIGRGLRAAPRCLMLDEPSLGLAPIVVDTLADAVTALNREGLTILIVEQRVDLALRLAERGYVMETGRIVIEDRAEKLLNDPRVREAYLGA
jgi:branched-chain amino acid transport system ATP-binding protein